MKKSFLNYQFYKSFRMPITEKDKVFVKITRLNKSKGTYEGKLLNLNLNGLNFALDKKLHAGEEVEILIYTKRFINNWDFIVKGSIVRSFYEDPSSNHVVYGVKLEKQSLESELHYFLKDFINRFSNTRLRDFLLQSAISEKNVNTIEGIELYSLMCSLYVESSSKNLQEAVDAACEILQCEVGRIYKVKIETNTLENIYSSDKILLKEQDFRQGLTGSIFNSSTVLNLDLRRIEKHPFHKYEMKTALAHPLYNREHKTIGVIEFQNKFNNQKFTLKDETFIKLMASIISHHFDDFIPISRVSQIDELNPIEEKNTPLYIGTTIEAIEIRKILNSLKSKNKNLLIVGEKGVGKTKMATGLHQQGFTSKMNSFTLDCNDPSALKEHFSNNLEKAELDIPGVFLIKEISKLSIKQQKDLFSLIAKCQKRIITISSKDLLSQVENGSFLKKLYFLVSKVIIHLRPLRNRKSELIEITTELLKRESKKRNTPTPKLDDETIDRILEYSWPGNYSELEKTVKKAMMRYNEEDGIYLEIVPNNKKSRPHRNKILYKVINELASKTDSSIFFDTHKKILNEIVNKRKAS